MSNPAVVVKLVIDGKEFTGGVDAAQQRLAALGKSGQVSAAQTAAAWRTVPAQFTDVVTQLQGGASPFTVLLQQGGQLKDSFGGLGPMFSQLATLINPVNVALGAAGVAVGVLAAAYRQGSAEQDELARSLVLTGNAAGTTVGQLVGMAQALDGVAGTQAAASAALAQLAATGQVGAATLQAFAGTALRLERDVGQPVEQTVKTLAELGRAPVEASVKLNQSLNYLTKSTYDQIVAAEKAGDTAKAAELAQKAYASAMDTRAADLVQRLGLIERSWRGVTSAANGAWNAMLNVGRQNTLQEELAAAEAALAAFPEARRGTNAIEGDKRRTALRARIDELRMSIYMEGELAAAEGARAGRDKQAIQAAETARKKAQPTAGSPRPAYQPQFERLMNDRIRDSQALFESEDQRALDYLARQQAERQRVLDDHARQRLATEQQIARDVRDIGIDMMADHRQRGLAIIAADEQELRERLHLVELSADGQREAEDRLAAWRTARQAELTERLKPAWQRQLDGWRDNNRLMQESFDTMMGSLVRNAEDAWVEFATTGKLNIRGLVNTALAEMARLQFRQFIGGLGGGGGGGLLGSLLGNVAGLFSPVGLGGNYGYNNLGLLEGLRATGGGVNPGGLYLVGESGPELLRMGASGGTVVPTQSVARTLAASAAGAGAGAAQGLSLSFPTSIQIDARSDQAQVAQAVAAGMQQTEKRMWAALRMRGLVR